MYSAVVLLLIKLFERLRRGDLRYTTILLLKHFYSKTCSRNLGLWVSFSAAAYTQHDIVGSDPPATRAHVIIVVVVVVFCIAFSTVNLFAPPARRF